MFLFSKVYKGNIPNCQSSTYIQNSTNNMTFYKKMVWPTISVLMCPSKWTYLLVNKESFPNNMHPKKCANHNTYNKPHELLIELQQEQWKRKIKIIKWNENTTIVMCIRTCKYWKCLLARMGKGFWQSQHNNHMKHPTKHRMMHFKPNHNLAIICDNVHCKFRYNIVAKCPNKT